MYFSAFLRMKRTKYTGKSRTTKWRKRKRGEVTSSSDSECDNQDDNHGQRREPTGLEDNNENESAQRLFCASNSAGTVIQSSNKVRDCDSDGAGNHQSVSFTANQQPCTSHATENAAEMGRKNFEDEIFVSGPSFPSASDSAPSPSKDKSHEIQTVIGVCHIGEEVSEHGVQSEDTAAAGASTHYAVDTYNSITTIIGVGDNMSDHGILPKQMKDSTAGTRSHVTTEAAHAEHSAINSPVHETPSEQNSAERSSISIVSDEDWEVSSNSSSDNDSLSQAPRAEDSDDEFSSDLECYEAHFLEEEPVEQQEEPQGLAAQPLAELQDAPQEPEDPDEDPDDPGNPNNPNEEESDEDENEGGDDNHEVANFVHQNLNIPLVLHENLTEGEIRALELASAVRHHKTFLSILDTFCNLNLLFGPKCYPECKSKLWSIILLNRAGIQCHVYCSRRECGQYIGRRDLMGDYTQCQCGFNIETKKAKFFVTLDLMKQLKEFLGIPGIWNKLQYRFTRQKVSPTGIEDVYDGELYKLLQQVGGILANPHNFSYFFSTDGCNPTKKGSIKMWPIYIRINELPPDMRQKFHFMAGVWIDHVDPNFQAFFKPFVRQANILSTRGITWKPDGVNEITSKFIPIGHCCDSPARYGILNMSHWNSDYGCTYCTHMGKQAAGNQRYPFIDLEEIPAFEERTDEGMRECMVNAEENQRSYLGHKGVCQMLLLENHNLREGQAQDDLHQDHEGCAADITDLLLTTAAARVNPQMTNIGLIRSIDHFLLRIKTPSRISRKPRSIGKRSKFSGTEFRNWLIFYSVPLLTGLIHPEYVNMIARLSHACYLLSQDVIEPEDLEEAERLLEQYGRLFEETFGVEKIKFNLHVTVNHKVNSVRKLGNPWNCTTYNFESLNMKHVKDVTSPKGAIMQIVTRSLLYLTVYSAQYDERLSESVRQRLDQILNKQPLKRVHQVGPKEYVVGRCVERAPSAQEAEVLAREGLHIQNFREYRSFLIGNTRYKSIHGQNPDIKSDDTVIYTFQETFCTIRNVLVFMDDNGEERCGLLVLEHEVEQVLPIARHISVLRNDVNLLHYISIDQVRCPAIKMDIRDVLYAVCVPNCYEID